MVAPADHPAFSPDDGARLAAFFERGQCYMALARSLSQPLGDVLSWALLPHIRQAIELMQRARCEARRSEALDILQNLARESTDPVEIRRAATAIVRIAQYRPSRFDDPRHRIGTPGAPGAPFRPARPLTAPHDLVTADPAAPAPCIPPHFRRVSEFVYSETPSRSLKPRQSVANALALIRQGDAHSLQALFHHSTYSGRFKAGDPDSFEHLARQKFAGLLHFQAAFAAPLIQTERQRARQDVIVIPRSGDPLAFTVHLHYPMFGESECCWLIDRYTRSPRTADPPQHPHAQTTPADSS